MTQLLKLLGCMPWSASKCHENCEIPVSCPSFQTRGGSPVGNSLAGSGSAPALLQFVALQCKVQGTSDALSISTGCPAPRTDVGREQHLPKHPPASASKWGTAPMHFFFDLLCSKTPKSHRWTLEIRR